MNDDTPAPDRQPAPDDLLAATRLEPRGRLKIYLGAAPGVGKTYAMLRAAQAHRRDGVDLVIGWVETHGRRETAALLHGLERIPPRRYAHRGHVIDEMDLDAILRRRPTLVLVDELAHSNAPGCRHPKRHQDVAELLAAGIDVETTLNIQHLDSLSEVVARITHIEVRETVPDSVLDRADEIELIDISPESLIDRLKDGKIYLPEQARRALHHFFTASNLTALRELALRRTAERVDAQMVEYLHQHGIAGPWPTSERIMVCVDHGANGDHLVRTACRIAERLHARWQVVHVETPANLARSAAERTTLADTLRLAERLGGDVIVLPAARIAATLLDHATHNNTTLILLGRPHRPAWHVSLRGSVTTSIIRHAGAFGILVLAPEGASTHRTAKRPYWLILVLIIAAGLASGWLPPPWPWMISLSTLMIGGAVWGLGQWLYRARQAERRRTRLTRALSHFSHDLTGIGRMEELIFRACQGLDEALMLVSLVLLATRDGLDWSVGRPSAAPLSASDRAAAEWALHHGTPAGRDSDTLPGASYSFLPLMTARSIVGVLGWHRQEPLRPDEHQLLLTLTDQIAIAIERLHLAGCFDAPPPVIKDPRP